MNDYLVRATAANQQIRAFAVSTRELTEYARSAHNTSPVATAALGRLLSAGCMMGSMMKGEKDVLTLQVQGDGPLQGILVTADSAGHVKGYVGNPGVLLPPSPAGKLDVGGAVGSGSLKVIRDLGLKEPYSGQTELQTGEIAEDLTYYFAASEQIPSAVGLGVLMNADNTVCQAGGFILQLMPYAEERVIEALEAKIASIEPVTAMLDRRMTPEDILELLVGDLGLEITETIPVSFRCDCSRERVMQVISSISRRELAEIIADQKPIEVQCHFCNKKYGISIEELVGRLHETRVH